MATERAELDLKIPLHVALAVVTIYHNQELDERSMHATVYQNGVGFNGVDAAFGTSTAEQLLGDRPLTRKQLPALAKMLGKYKRQLNDFRWWETELPERVHGIMEHYGEKPKEKPVVEGDGTLRLDEDGKLEFDPNVYPTKQLKGYGWRRGKRQHWTWVINLSLEAINTILRFWPDVLVEEDVQALVDQLLEAQTLPDEIDKHPILFPFQKDAIQFLYSHPKAMLALAPGLGKTACSLFAADITPDTDQILVIAPLTLVWNWQAEIRKWLGEDSVKWHGGRISAWPEPERWVVTNYETVARNLDAFLDEAWDLVIIDESILVKNRKAKRTKALKGLASEVDRVWELSGSPTSRHYDDLWAQLNILDPKRFSSYWRFAETYCFVDQGNWGWSITGNRPGSAKQLQEDLADIFFARTQDQVLDLPDWIFEDVEVPLYGDQWKMYAQMEEKFWADLGDDQIVLSPNVLSQLTRLIQLASGPSILGSRARAAKWDTAVAMLEWVDLPAIIWTNFIATGEKVAGMVAKKGYSVATLTGKTKQNDREEIVNAFQDGELDVIIAHPKVGKFGLTLTAGRTAIYLERNYEGDNYYQSLHRVRRIGTTERPRIIHLLATDPHGNGWHTVDHLLNQVLRYRKDSSMELTTDHLLQAKEGYEDER